MDPGSPDTLTYSFYWNNDGEYDLLGQADPQASHTFMDNGNYEIGVKVADDDGGTSTTTCGVVILDLGPTAEFTWTPEPQNEGSPVQFTDLSTSYPDAITNWYWMFRDGNSASEQSPKHVYGDNGDYMVILTVTDDDRSTDPVSYLITVLNVAPTLGPISTTHDPVAVGSVVTASADFNDLGFFDTHTTVWDWGDSTTSAGTVTETDGSGTVTGTHMYTAAGVYTVTLTVTDDGDSDTAVFQYIVVYDPEGGFITGGGWIMSPEGAYTPDPSLTGKATFGFVSKYKKGATTPTGNTEFIFHTGDLEFHSSSYEWLVIAGTNAKYKGTGTVNGEGEFGFMLTASDGDSSETPDTFRIKIWNKASDETIYDNKMELSDDEYSGTVLDGGNIVVHKAK